MPSIDEAITNLESALSQLKEVLKQENILVQSVESDELVTNQDPKLSRLTMPVNGSVFACK